MSSRDISAAMSPASLETLVRLTSVVPWSHEAIEEYKRKQLRAERRAFAWKWLIWTVVIGALLSAGVWALEAGDPLSIAMGFISLNLIAGVIGSDMQWRTSRVAIVEWTYWRTSKRHTLPPAIEAWATQMLALCPGVGFAVSFIGPDPILWAMRGEEEIAAIVWDELPRGRIKIIPPPNH